MNYINYYMNYIREAYLSNTYCKSPQDQYVADSISKLPSRSQKLIMTWSVNFNIGHRRSSGLLSNVMKIQSWLPTDILKTLMKIDSSYKFHNLVTDTWTKELRKSHAFVNISFISHEIFFYLQKEQKKFFFSFLITYQVEEWNLC